MRTNLLAKARPPGWAKTERPDCFEIDLSALRSSDARMSIATTASHKDSQSWTISDRSPLHDVRQQASLPKEKDKPFSHGRAKERIISNAASRPDWWSQTGSNRRPPACKAGALPTELWPLQRSEIGQGDQHCRSPFPIPDICNWWAWEDLNFRPHAYQARALTS